MRPSDRLLTVHVRPRSSRSELLVRGDGGIVARVRAAAVEGAANRACVALIADAAGVPKSAVQIVRGARGRAKEIAVAGLTADELRARLVRAAAGEEGSP